MCGGVSCEFELFMSKTDYSLTQRYIESSSDAPGFGFFFFFVHGSMGDVIFPKRKHILRQHYWCVGEMSFFFFLRK